MLRRLFTAALATLALAAGGIWIAGPAYAVTSALDDFEGPFPYDRWGIVESQPNSLVYLGISGAPYRGRNLALLHARNNVYAQIYSRYGVTLARPGSGVPICNANVMIQLTNQSAQDPAFRQATVYLRLWAGTARNVPPLTESVYTLTQFEPYQQYQFGSFAFQPSTPIYFEISATNGMVLFDDAYIGCINSPR